MQRHTGMLVPKYPRRRRLLCFGGRLTLPNAELVLIFMRKAIVSPSVRFEVSEYTR